MSRVFDILGQGLAYLLFALFVGYFANSPSYSPFKKDQALVRLSISYPGQRIAACRKLSVKEMRKKTHNMRRAFDCPRERHAVRIEVLMDGKPFYDEIVAPSGLANDGKSLFYENFPVPAGDHMLTARLYDNGADGKAGFSGEKNVQLTPGKVAIVGFDHRDHKIMFR